jgi:predicted nucleic-acid-binding protein
VIGLDTNVLVRYLTQDDPVQSVRATRLIERGLTIHDPGFVSMVVLVETVWVLRRTYGVRDAEMVAILESLLAADTLFIEQEAAVFRATALMKAGLGGFADALIATIGDAAGCLYTVTFDRSALRLPSFRPI